MVFTLRGFAILDLVQRYSSPFFSPQKCGSALPTYIELSYMAYFSQLNIKRCHVTKGLGGVCELGYL